MTKRASLNPSDDFYLFTSVPLGGVAVSQQKDLPTWKRVVAGFSLALCIFLTGVIFLIVKQIYTSELRGPITFGFALAGPSLPPTLRLLLHWPGRESVGRCNRRSSGSMGWSLFWKPHESEPLDSFGCYQAIRNPKEKERQALIASIYPWPPDST